MNKICGALRRTAVVDDGEDEPNLNQMMESVLEDGYIYEQGCVDGAEEGDMRIFLLDGHLIEVDGHVSAFRRGARQHQRGRQDATRGGHRGAACDDRGDADKLVRDGMFFVGIDVIGDKVVEINAESPGGLGDGASVRGRICPIVIDALEPGPGLTLHVTTWAHASRTDRALEFRAVALQSFSACQLQVGQVHGR